MRTRSWLVRTLVSALTTSIVALGALTGWVGVLGAGAVTCAWLIGTCVVAVFEAASTQQEERHA